jgi:S-adenosylmethionine:tRNA ribosyltransferase-isomerase
LLSFASTKHYHYGFTVIIKFKVMLRIEDYNYNLPSSLIAQEPARPRDGAKLLIYKLADRSIKDDHFYNLNNYLEKNSSLVINNTKVKKARLKFGSSEIFILEELGEDSVWALVFPGKKFKAGRTLSLSPRLSVEVLEVNSEGHRKLKFNKKLSDSIFNQFKLTPLPPYIKQDESLAGDYQTVFAEGEEASLAAPTAGLHFTDKLLARIKANHPVINVNLTVGLGTFASINQSDINNKKLHSETWNIEEDQLLKLKQAKSITAVGTTSIRTLESAGENFKLSSGHTEIFIQPGYKFNNVDSLITNFHLPKTSLLMLISAFLADKLNLSEPKARKELIRIYQHAVDLEYKFFSFGDAMLIV